MNGFPAMPHAFDILATIALIYGAAFSQASISPAASGASCRNEGDPENGSRVSSLKAALAGEIVGANEVGVKRAEARPSLRSQFRIGRRRTPVSRVAMWRNNRLRPGHGVGLNAEQI